MLLAAESHTGWLPPAIRRDRWGFIVTGDDLLTGGRPRLAGPSSARRCCWRPACRVFTAGDVRHGSIKRVTSAVDEGWTAVRLIHQHLSDE